MGSEVYKVRRDNALIEQAASDWARDEMELAIGLTMASTSKRCISAFTDGAYWMQQIEAGRIKVEVRKG